MWWVKHNVQITNQSCIAINAISKKKSANLQKQIIPEFYTCQQLKI